MRARAGTARDRGGGDRLGHDHAPDGLGAARPLRRGAGAGRRAQGHRPLALGDRRRRLHRRPLLLGQVARALPRISTLPYLAIEELGGLDLAADAAGNAADSTSPRWVGGHGAAVRAVRLRPRPGAGDAGADRGRDAGGLGTHAPRRGDPVGAAPDRCAANRRSARARVRHDRGGHAGAGDDPLHLRRRVLLARDLDRARVRGVRGADARARRARRAPPSSAPRGSWPGSR